MCYTNLFYKNHILTVDGHRLSFGWETNQILIDETVVGSYGFAVTKDPDSGGNRIGPMGIDAGGFYIIIDNVLHHIQLSD